MLRRKTAVAGPRNFYPNNPQQLRTLIEECYLSPMGPGELPTKENTSSSKESLIAAVVPHAGLVYSGPEAAFTWLKVHQSQAVDTIILIGPNHHGLGENTAVFPHGSWETPFGDLAVDEALAKLLLSHKEFQGDTTAHLHEHSLEVQLPFIYHSGEVSGKLPKILPVALLNQSHDHCQRLGAILAKIIKESEKKILLVASSDFSHYVPSSYAKTNDPKAIDSLLNFQTTAMYQTINQLGLTPCGAGPMTTIATAAKILGSSKGKLLKYGTSGDIIPHDEVVGYASIIF